MEFQHLILIIFANSLLFGVVVSHAALPSEVYWKNVLPKTPIPKTVRDLLRPDYSVDQMKTTSLVGNLGVIKVSYSDYYTSSASKNQLQEYDPATNIGTFFLEKDLHPGKKMNLDFFKSTDGAAFLPHNLANTIPFSSNKLPEIFNRFSIHDPKSVEAIKDTIKDCEALPKTANEDKYCPTSLESMVDYVTSKMGTKVSALATELDDIKDHDQEITKNQEYVIAARSGVKKMVGDSSLVCHRKNYLYAVFYCHSIPSATDYVVHLVGADGTKIKAVAVCHKDTSAWNPKHFAFHVLKVKPGTVPICHFVALGNIVWVGKNINN